MKECSYQCSASFQDGGHSEKTWKSSKWTACGAAEELLAYMRKVIKDPHTKGLKQLSINLTIK